MDSDLYAGAGRRPAGRVSLVSAEAKEVTVILISGAFNMSDMGKLEGDLGIPADRSSMMERNPRHEEGTM